VQGSSGRRFATAIGFPQFARMLGGFCGKVRGRSPRAWPERVAVVLNLYGRRLRAGRSPFAVRDTGTPRADKRVNGTILTPFKAVVTNPKSYRRGIIRGLLFMPTTIGNMIWGDTFLGVGTRQS
jgi:hypothetical protein